MCWILLGGGAIIAAGGGAIAAGGAIIGAVAGGLDGAAAVARNEAAAASASDAAIGGGGAGGSGGGPAGGFIIIVGGGAMAAGGCDGGGICAGGGIMAALIQRGTTGRGTSIDVSMLESIVEWMGYPMYYAFEGQPQPPRAGASHSTISTSRRLRDGRATSLGFARRGLARLGWRAWARCGVANAMAALPRSFRTPLVAAFAALSMSVPAFQAGQCTTGWLDRALVRGAPHS